MDNAFEMNLIKLLSKNAKFVDEAGNINKIKVKDYALKLDEELLELLISNSETTKKFFMKVKDVYVFNLNDFIFYISDKNFLSNSYTKFKNRIGLNHNNYMLSEIHDVVLNFPFKDCILEGGQDKEDAKREEIFYNQILANDEIDRLLDEKVLTKFTRFTSKGEENVEEFKRDKSGLIRENLIIKGNNLLALHSLKKEFFNKIKVIYIDPPYYFDKNQSEDTFRYNSNFKLSTWLTFMKNRLEVARELLTNDGLIFIQINDDAHAYLKILMDDIFKSENFVNNLIVKPSNPVGLKMKNTNNRIIKTKENILVFAKNYNLLNLNSIYTKYENFDHYNLYLEKNNSDDPNKWEVKRINTLINKKNPSPEELKEFAIKNIENIYCSSFIADRRDRVEFAKKNPEKITIYKNPDESEMYMYKKRTLFPLIKRSKIIDGKMIPAEKVCDLWLDIKWDGIANEGKVTFKGGKKPEKLISRIIDLVTVEGDIILDYHLGSGSTCAVAHKKNIQYIGIEQLDYKDDDSIVRLKKVIEGEQSGISKEENWKGGGNFIYCELKTLNEEAISKIKNCNTLKELINLFDELYEKYFLNYNLEIKDFKENIITNDDFKKLKLEEQKKLFHDILDLNRLYLNFSEIEDTKFKVSKEEIELNKKFYNY